jgi:hypothetical protein
MSTHRTIATMKLRTTSLLVALALVSLSVPVNLTAAESAESSDGNAPQIDGSWICTNTRINQGVSFTAVLSFGTGGVLLATGSIAGPALLQGGWSRANSHRVDSTIYFFAYDPAGNAVAMIKTVQSFQLTGQDELVGTGASYACDLQSQNCKEDPSVRIEIKGRRIVSEKQSAF